MRLKYWGGLILIVLFVNCSFVQLTPDKISIIPPKDDVLLVANQHSGSVTMIEVQTGRTVAHIPVGAGPHELTASADGRTAVVPLFGRSFLWGDGYGRELAVIDVASATVTKKIDLGNNTSPHGAVFLGDDRTVAVTSADARTVVVVNIETGNIVGAIQIGHSPYLITGSQDRQFVYTTNPGTNTLTELNIVSPNLQRTFSVSGEPGGMAVSPDRKNVWVLRTGDDGLSVIDLQTGEITKTFEGIDILRRAGISPDGRILLVTSAALNEVLMFDVAEKQEVGRIPLGEGILPSGVIFGADSKIAYVTSPRSNLVLELDVEKRTVLRKFNSESSPDGIIYVRRTTD